MVLLCANALLSIDVSMRNQFSCHPKLRNCKTCTPVCRGNAVCRSGSKRGVSEVGFREKRPQVKSSTVKIINLTLHPVRPYTRATRLLTRTVSHDTPTGSKAYLMTMGSRNAKQAVMKQEPNLEEFDNNGTLGSPKADFRACYGDGSGIVAGNSEGRKDLKRKESLSITNLSGQLRDLYDFNEQNPECVNTKVIHKIADVNTLKLAYEIIRSKPGNMTPANDRTTLDGTSLRTLERLSQKLKAGKFKFSPARRTYIPKPGKKELRPLTIASPREKIVQKALELVLTGIYEPSFLHSSHGFRPHRGTHTALKMIDQVCKNANWFIEADINKCFDTIDHKTLMALLQKRINCDKMLALLHSALKAGYFTPDLPHAQTGDVGTPQGSVVSPILCNIYMHQLDLFMNQLMQKENRGKRKRQNPAYTQLANRLAKAKLQSTRVQLRRQMKQIPATDNMDPNMVRINYVRYADDFIISVLGPYSLAQSVKLRAENFLSSELSLKVNQTKTVVTNTKRQGAKFLGTIIRTGKPSEKPQIRDRRGRKTRVTPRVSLHAPVKEIFDKLKVQGFTKQNHGTTSHTPTAVRRMTNMDHADILAYYNSVTRGILAYYSFADNRKSLGSVARALQMSCARTMALKYKLRFASKAFKRFGRLLKDPNSKIQLYLPETYKRTRTFNIKAPLGLKAIEKSWSNKLTKSGLNRSCVVCGAKPVEMHHLRSIKERRSRKHLDWFATQMVAINRKQVPLCKMHHGKLHGNKMTAEERHAFQQGCKALIS